MEKLFATPPFIHFLAHFSTMQDGEPTKEANTRRQVRIARIPPWLISLFDQWKERNSSVAISQHLDFAKYVANTDDFTKFGSRFDTEVKNILTQNKTQQQEIAALTLAAKKSAGERDKLRRDQAIMCQEWKSNLNSLRAELGVRGVKRSSEDSEDLKEPMSQGAFDAVRQTLFKFNKRNYRRSKKGEAVTWGEDGQYDIICNRKSLEAWLDSEHALKLGLNSDVITNFNVCVFRGELATLDREFEGGVGIEALWWPDDAYDTRYKPSRGDCNSSLADPRHGYTMNGVKWVPGNKRVSPN